MAGQKIGGIANLYVDGETFLVRGSFSYGAHTKTRASVAGVDTVHGYSEAPRVPFIAADISVTGAVTQERLNGMVDVTVVVELNNGTRVTGRNMWQVGELETNATEGQMSVRFEGPAVEEETANG